MKTCDNSFECMNKNDKYERVLRSVSGADNHDIVTANHFFFIKVDALESFVRVRIVEDLCEINEKDIPTLKEKFSESDKEKTSCANVSLMFIT